MHEFAVDIGSGFHPRNRLFPHKVGYFRNHPCKIRMASNKGQTPHGIFGMIISASYRSDIPAFHAAWFRKQLVNQAVRVPNPYGGKATQIDLSPGAVDGYLFWTRNPLPFLSALDDVDSQGTPWVMQVTVTGMPKALEARTPDTDAIVKALKALRSRYGPKAIVWRFDPVLQSDVWSLDQQRERFIDLSQALKGVTDEVCVSWATLYRKTVRNLTRHGVTALDPSVEEKRAFFQGLAEIAQDRAMQLTVCSQPDLVPEGGKPAACVDASRLSDVAGRDISARRKGNRPGCACAESRDIGSYDSCAHGCFYCYAVNNHEKAHAEMKPGPRFARAALKPTP